MVIIFIVERTLFWLRNIHLALPQYAQHAITRHRYSKTMYNILVYEGPAKLSYWPHARKSRYNNNFVHCCHLMTSIIPFTC